MASKPKAGLGRGLDALLGDFSDDLGTAGAETSRPEPAADGEAVLSVSLADIDPNRDQPRRRFDEAALEELADSIRAVGVLQPILCAKNGDRYTIIAGERRWRAARMAGLLEIPVIVRDWDETRRLEAALVENLQRDDLNPVEEAQGVQRLMDECGLTQEQTAERLGRSRPAVANLLRLLTLPVSIQDMLRDGRLSAGHARALVPLERADQVIYAGSLVNPALLARCKAGCRILNSAAMTLEQVIAAMAEAEAQGLTTVRLHTGDPSLYGAIREQMAALDEHGIEYDVTPGVSSFCAAAASLHAEYTLPGLSQSLIITRMAGRTPVPEREGIAAMAQHGASMALFLSAGMLDKLQAELRKGAYTGDTPAASVYKASWPEESCLRCTLSTLAETARAAQITKTALVLVGDFLDADFERSRLYAPDFTTGYRKGTDGT